MLTSDGGKIKSVKVAGVENSAADTKICTEDEEHQDHLDLEGSVEDNDAYYTQWAELCKVASDVLSAITESIGLAGCRDSPQALQSDVWETVHIQAYIVK